MGVVGNRITDVLSDLETLVQFPLSTRPGFRSDYSSTTLELTSMAQDNKQLFLTFLVTSFVIIGIVLIVATLISEAVDRGNTLSNARPLSTRSFSSEFLTVPASTRLAPTATATPAPTTRVSLPTPED